MRINKYLANSKVASRRKCEEFVTSGQIKVNGKIIRDLSTIINETDKIEVNGKPVKPANDLIYIIMNKPKGVVTTCNDEKGRRTVLDILDKELTSNYRLFPVGRLDYNTSGLLILTNDGDFTRRLTHPSTKVKKVYQATLDRDITPQHLHKLETGIDIDGEITHPAKARICGSMSHTTAIYSGSNVIELTITQGRNRQVRKMFESLGYNVVDLKRIAIGSLQLGKLRTREYKILSSPPM